MVKNNAEYLRELRKKAKARGVCIVCRKRPAITDRISCEECTSARKARYEKHCAERIGLCKKCGGPLPAGRSWNCLNCRPNKGGSRQGAAAIHKRALIPEAKCERCARPAAPWMVFCVLHGLAYATELKGGSR